VPIARERSSAVLDEPSLGLSPVLVTKRLDAVENRFVGDP